MVVVGAGHNGLTCAAYLARAGLDVVVLERRDRVGGACTIEEPWPGYRVSPCAYVVGLLHGKVAEELDLAKRGLRTTLFDPQLYAPLDDGNVFVEWLDLERTATVLEVWSPGASPGLAAMSSLESHIHRALRGDGEGWDDLWLRIEPPTPDEVADRLGRPEAVAAVFEDSLVDYLGRFFDDGRIIDALSGQGVIGESVSPRHPGTAWVRIHHSLGNLGGQRGAWGLVHGGIGVIAVALTAAAEDAGASVIVEAPVAGIHPGRGVVLEDGTVVEAPVVVSNADPVRTEALLGGGGDFSYAEGASAKVNFALSAPPPFPEEATKAMINVGASVELLDKGAAAAASGRLGERLWAEIYSQTGLDTTVAPKGKHLLSCFVQYVPYHLEGGWNERRRDEVARKVTEEIERHAPGFANLVEQTEVTVPPDIEEKIGLTGGQIFQGGCLPPRMWSNRCSYKTQFDGVYRCGAGTHPGGSVIAVNGRNAAMRVLKDRS